MNTPKQLDPKQLAFLADRIMSAARFPFVYTKDGFTLRNLLVARMSFTLSSSHDPHDPRGDSMTVSGMAQNGSEGIDCMFAVKAASGEWGMRMDDAGSFFLSPHKWFKIHEVLSVLGYTDPTVRYQIVDSGYACPVGLVDDFEALTEKLRVACENLISETQQNERTAWESAWVGFNAFVKKHCVVISDGFTFENPKR